MSLTKGIVVAIVPVFFLLGVAYGEPSKPIAQAMNTPMSVFDYFLSSLDSQLGCPNNPKEEYCINSLDYDFDDNLFRIRFWINYSPDTFNDKDEKQRQKLLTNYLSRLTESLFIQDGKYFMAGQLRYVLGFDEMTFREEVAKRTVIYVDAMVEDIWYTATRDNHGKVEYSKGRYSERISNPKREDIK